MARSRSRSRSKGKAPVTPAKSRSRSRGRGSNKSGMTSRSWSVPAGQRMPQAMVVDSSRSRSRSRSRSASRSSTRRAMITRAQSKSSGFLGLDGAKRLTPFDMHAKQGVVICREYGSTVTELTNNNTWIGHCTLNRVNLQYDMCRAIVKFFANVMGFELKDFSEQINGNGSLKYQLQISYRPDPFSAISYIFTSNQAGTVTFNALVADLHTQVDALLNAASAKTDIQFQTLFINTFDAAGTVPYETKRYNLRDSYFKIHCKSALKLQNRTTLTDGDDSDDVDNVPLYGKFYEGTGNFIGLYSPDGVGSNQYIGAASATQYLTMQNSFAADTPNSEPPTYSQVSHVQKIGKAHLDPGQLKTSVLTTTVQYNVNHLIKMIIKGTENANQDIFWKGNYRIFCLEKMLQAEATAAATAIRVAYEADCKTGITFICKRQENSGTIVDSTPN